VISTEAAPPSVIDGRARADGTSIGTIRKLIPKECFEIDEARSWRGVLMAFARLAVATAILTLIQPVWGLGLLWQIPALLAAWLFSGWCFTGIFVIGHDCAHMAFSKRRWVNEAVGHVCLAVGYTAFHNWRIWHNHHHGKTQLRGQDPDWPERMMTREEYDKAPFGDKAHVRLGFGTPLGMLVGFWVGMFRRTFMKQMAPQIPITRDAPRQLLFSSLFMFATSGSIIALLVHFGGAWTACKYYLVPTFIAATHGALLTYLHHTSADALVFDDKDWTPLRGQVISTFNVRFPRWIEAMWFDINIHLVHHLAPKVPWYHLHAATEAIKKERPEMVQERVFSFGYLRASWARPLLTRSPGHDFYEMSSFDEAPQEAFDAAE
jgi:omega-6 fatty acid desaturase (delta-12 desaturase)